MARTDLLDDPIKHKLYTKWSNMIQRCTNKNNRKYPIYGRRGIKVCDEWKKFDNFYKDMIKSFKIGLTLDRIDTNEGYFKGNCRWVDQSTQQNNRRDTDIIEFNGIKASLTSWAKKLGIKQATLWCRIYRWNWSIERALTEGVHNGRYSFK